MICIKLTRTNDVSAELPLVSIFVQKSTFPENSQKFTKILFSPKTPRARRIAGGGPLGHQREARRAPPWPRLVGLWEPRATSPAPLRYLGHFVPEMEKPRRIFFQIRYRAPPTPETLVRGSEVPVLAPCRDGDWRGDPRHRHRQHLSINHP